LPNPSNDLYYFLNHNFSKTTGIGTLPAPIHILLTM